MRPNLKLPSPKPQSLAPRLAAPRQHSQTLRKQMNPTMPTHLTASMSTAVMPTAVTRGLVKETGKSSDAELA